jgi:uncharacterized protein
MRIVVLADTHIPDFAKALPAALAPALRRADLILHAGDVNRADVLDELSSYAPVRVALGNNDRPDVEAWGATETVRLDLDGVRLAMLHDSGPRPGRELRMRRRFPDADVVVFGHSHIPIDATTPDGLRLFNPGSPTWKRRQPLPTFGSLMVRDGRVRSRIVELPA